MKVTVLGCGSSAGVPVLGHGWGACDKNNPKNRRTRTSIIIESEHTSLLIDMSPDLREQLLNYGSCKIDAVIFTHGHNDHTNGINELRPLFLGKENTLNIYAKQQVIEIIRKAFFYLFDEKKPPIYKPYITLHELKDGEFSIGDISGVCFEQDHGFSKSLGIRIGNFAYSTDVVSMSEENFEKLQGIDTWIVDCLTMAEARPTHAHLDLVLDWVKRLKPKRTFLTHMGTSMDYETLVNILPENIRPAYDKMIIFVD